MPARAPIEVIRAAILDWIASWDAGAPDPDPETRFEALARDLFSFQYEQIAAYRAWCDQQGRTPQNLGGAADIPLVPVTAFKRRQLATMVARVAPAAVFETSGTSDGAPGRVMLAETLVYDASLRAAFRRHVLPDGVARAHRCLSLVPGPDLRPRSSLGHMVRVLTETWDDGGGAGHLRAVRDGDDHGELDLDALCRDLKLAVLHRVPVLLLTTSIALEMMLQAWPQGLRLQLPAGSRVMDTGGPKGRHLSTDRAQQHAWLVQTLGLQPWDIVGELGMTELCSQRYETVTRARIIGDVAAARLYVGPPWLRSVVLEPGSLTPVPMGELGIVGHLDLANLDTCAFVLTADLGRLLPLKGGGVGLELAGRVPGSEWRGCGLDVEDLL